MSDTKSIKEVQELLERAMSEMRKSDFKGLLVENDLGWHEAAQSCVTSALLLLRLAEEAEFRQGEDS